MNFNKAIRSLTVKSVMDLFKGDHHQLSRFQKMAYEVLKAKPGVDEAVIQSFIKVESFTQRRNEQITSLSRRYHLYKKNRYQKLDEYNEKAELLIKEKLSSLKDKDFLNVLSEFSNIQVMKETVKLVRKALKAKSTQDYIEYLFEQKILIEKKSYTHTNLNLLGSELEKQFNKTKSAQEKYNRDPSEKNELSWIAEINKHAFLEILVFANKDSLSETESFHQFQSWMQNRMVNNKKRNLESSAQFKQYMHDIELLLQVMESRENEFQYLLKEMMEPFYEYTNVVMEALNEVVETADTGKTQFGRFVIKKTFLLTSKNAFHELEYQAIEEMWQRSNEFYKSNEAVDIVEIFAIAVEIDNRVSNNGYPLKFNKEHSFPIEKMMRSLVKPKLISNGGTYALTLSIKPAEYKTLLGTLTLAEGSSRLADKSSEYVYSFLHGFADLKNTLHMLLTAVKDNESVVNVSNDPKLLEDFKRFVEGMEKAIEFLEAPTDHNVIYIEHKLKQAVKLIINIFSSANNLVLLTKSKLSVHDIKGYFNEDEQVMNMFRLHSADIHFNNNLIKAMISRTYIEILIQKVEDYRLAEAKNNSEAKTKIEKEIMELHNIISVFDLQMPVLEEVDFKNIQVLFGAILKENNLPLQPVIIDFSRKRRFEELLLYFFNAQNSVEEPLIKYLKVDYKTLGILNLGSHSLIGEVNVFDHNGDPLSGHVLKLFGLTGGYKEVDFLRAQFTQLVQSMLNDKYDQRSFYVTLHQSEAGHPEIKLYSHESFAGKYDISDYFYNRFAFDFKLDPHKDEVLLTESLKKQPAEFRSALAKIYEILQMKSQKYYAKVIEDANSKSKNSQKTAVKPIAPITEQNQQIVYLPKSMNEFSLKNNPFIFFDPEELNRQQLKEKVVDLKNNYVIERAEGPAFSSFTSFLKNIVEKGYSALESYTKSLTAKKVKTPEVKKTNGATREFVFSEKTATVKPDPIVVTKPELLIKPLKETAYQNPYLGTPAIFDIDEVMETLKTKEFVILEINSKDFSKQSQSIKNDNETIYSFNTYLGFTKKGQKSLVDFNAYNKNPVIKKFNFLGIPFLKRELHNDHPAGGETSSIYIGQGKHGRTKINSVFYIKLTGILLSSEMQSEVHTFKLEPVDKNLVMTVNPHHDSDTNRFEGHSSISQDGHALILEFRP